MIRIQFFLSSPNGMTRGSGTHTCDEEVLRVPTVDNSRGPSGSQLIA